LSEDGWWWDGGQIDAIVVTLAPEPETGEGVQPRLGAAEVAERYRLDLSEIARRERHEGRAGHVATVPLPPAAGADGFGWESLPARLILLGVGDGSVADLREAGAALGKAAAGLGSIVMTAALGATAEGLRAFVTGALLASYRTPWLGQGKRPGTEPAQRFIFLDVDAQAERAVAAGQRSAAATCEARWLAAIPSNIKNPQWLAEQAERLGAGIDHLTVTVHDAAWLRRNGFGALLAVGGGSASDPRLVVLDYDPPGAAGDTVALVGKGITFDTGGLSIKPRDAMIGMKTDMGGAAAVLAAAVAAAQSGVTRRFVAVLPLAENAVSGSSYRPGDVVTAWDGTTIEVTNTDAEGRMVLADALAWTVATHRPATIIDVATLTGAITLGLGRGHAGLYATSDELAEELTSAGAASGDHLWRMPLVEDYRASLESPVADLCHQSTVPHVGGGSITAALFLQHFVGDTMWAHLDIAGAGRTPKARADSPEGPTGFGAALLLSWLTQESD
ncbi:MAG TPA: leucyl aminopeptidase family protein, partial [Actinomycetaceae bacterium]|nr:leucyl aminopeptidase family protein [Actinomycetaceae bacterium]